MNNTLLQKLLHAGVLHRTNPEKFLQTFKPAPHIIKPVDPAKFDNYLDKTSKQVQQSMKFYLPIASEENELSHTELAKLTEDLEMYLPFKSTFVQVESSINFTDTNELYRNYDGTVDLPTWERQHNIETIDRHKALSHVLLIDTGKHDEEGSRMFAGTIWLYDTQSNIFVIDPNVWIYSFRKNGDYTFWLHEDSDFYDATDLRTISNNETYSNVTLNSIVGTIVHTHTQLCLYLSYPQIVDTKSVKGIKNIQIPLSRKFSHAEFLRKPKYEHKVLKLNLFDNDSSKEHLGVTNNEGGKAFHAVRKHIRKCNSGKITFVKAHFRGDKSKGIITKDYDINTGVK